MIKSPHRHRQKPHKKKKDTCWKEVTPSSLQIPAPPRGAWPRIRRAGTRRGGALHIRDDGPRDAPPAGLGRVGEQGRVRCRAPARICQDARGQDHPARAGCGRAAPCCRAAYDKPYAPRNPPGVQCVHIADAGLGKPDKKSNNIQEMFNGTQRGVLQRRAWHQEEGPAPVPGL